MSLTIRGRSLSSLQPVRYSEGRRNADGTMVTDVTFTIATNLLRSNLPRRGVDRHPTWSDFICDDFTWSTPLKGVTLLRVWYVAILPEAQPNGGNLPPDVEVEASNFATEEPIATLPNFLKQVGDLPAITRPIGPDGSPTDWKMVGGEPSTVDPDTGRFAGGADGRCTNGAVFDAYGQNKTPTAVDYNPYVGRFLYFQPGSKLVGVESVLRPYGEWSYTYSTKTMPNLSDVGKIGQPAGLPPAGAPINYLLVAKRFRRTGVIYRVTEVWRRSGPRGWSELIYQKTAS